MNRDDEKVEFLERVIFGKAIHGKNINEAIELCFRKANQDASRPFSVTINKIPKNKKESYKDTIKNEISDARVNACVNYLQNKGALINNLKDSIDFDDFCKRHKKMCKGLLACVKKSFDDYRKANKESDFDYEEQPLIYESLGYAQKVINLTYKYLYVTDRLIDIDSAKINYLHATIDDKIIKKLEEDGGKYSKYFPREDKYPKYIPWSQIKINEYGKYKEVQKAIGDKPFMWELETFNKDA